MFLVVGLGNPGSRYEGTRHNVGFEVVKLLSEQYGVTFRSEHKALAGKCNIKGQSCILALPQTFMNLSGESVRALMDFYKIPAENLIVIHDDIDLPVGKLRIREKGSAGGHNGMKNIILHTGTQAFVRVRVGVGAKPEYMDLADYVLGHFTGDDEKEMILAFRKAAECVEMILEDGGTASRAMNSANGGK